MHEIISFSDNPISLNDEYKYEYKLVGTGYPPQHIASDQLGHGGFTFS